MYILDVIDAFQHDFQAFAYTNNIITMASGLAIGLSSKQFIQDSLELIVLPILIYIVQLFNMHKLHDYVLNFVSQTFLTTFIMTLGQLSWTILNWILTIILTFVIMEYILNRWIIGVKTSIKESDKASFIKAKADAKASDIIPDQEQIHVIKKQDAEEAKLGQKMIKQDIKKIVGSENQQQQKQENQPQPNGDIDITLNWDNSSIPSLEQFYYK